jgi:branched-chain amino acid transport system ATP-binding protein
VTALLEAERLRCGYRRGAPIVRDLDLHVAAGEVVALLGPNGAGKTTTLRTLSGELGALGGQVRLGGRAAAASLHRRARAGVSVVTEERNVVAIMTLADNLRVARCDPARVTALFPELGEHLGRQVALLSGGQQQMIALGIALARPTTVLLADELSLGLAPLLVDRLLDAIRTAARDGVGVLLVEQHVDKALAVADRAYVLQRGRVELSGSAAELRDRLGDVRASYLSA